ncbi:MAG: hypothetical protein ACHQ1D_03350 [Nitrososphaerales archaeon]
MCALCTATWSTKIGLKKPRSSIKKKRLIQLQINMTIQILHYEFLGPIKLAEWGPPMSEVVFVILARNKDIFNIIYIDQSEKTNETDFFTKNKKFKCWLTHTGSEDNLYLSIYPMIGSDEKERNRIVNKALEQYKPICNVED